MYKYILATIPLLFFAVLFMSPNAGANVGEDVAETKSISVYAKYKNELSYDNVAESLINHIKSKKNLVYVRGCKTQPCYDCSGLLSSFLYENNIKYHGPLSSGWIYKNGSQKNIRETKRGDTVFFLPQQEGGLMHIAVAMTGFNGSQLSILDAILPPKTHAQEREIPLYCTKTGCYYETIDNKRKVLIASNFIIERFINVMEKGTKLGSE